MDDQDWVLVKRPTNRDIWSPNLPNSEGSSPLKVRFNDPAKEWTDALPIGNGRLGAMVWGGVPSEVLNLNEDTLWTGGPGDYTDPQSPQVLSQVRKLVNEGLYAEATLVAAKLSGKSSEVYQPLGDLKIEFDNSHATYAEATYLRELDLDTATAKVKYSLDDVEFTREFFVSNPDQAVVVRISANKPGRLNFTVSLDCKLDHHLYVNGGSQIVLEGNCPGKRNSLKANQDGNPKGLLFSSVLDLQISDKLGSVHVLDDKKLRVEGCDWTVMVLVASSSFDGPFTNPSDSKRNPTSEAFSTMKSIKRFSYSELYARHVNDYQNLFHRVSLHLSKSSKSFGGNEVALRGKCVIENDENPMPTAERVKSFQTDEDPSLVELLFHYGRYLLISCSRPGTQASNLQGIWSKDISPPWDCAPHLNINLQMNYWPSLPCNLQECQEPLFDYISTLSVNGSKTAKVNYEASGWVAHQISDLWGKTSPDYGDPVWACWQMGGAWLCTHVWEHYTYTMDKDFLKNKAYPLLEGCASFLLDWLIEGPEGYLETNPSTSPEHKFIAPDGNIACVSYSSTMDMAIIREIFSAIVSAAEVLGKSDDGMIARVHEAQKRLRPTKIAQDGAIMEWVKDFKDAEVHHRHVSHLFGLYPGHTVTLEKDPELCRATGSSLFKRGEEGPGWSTTWKTALWARLRNPEHSYRMVKNLFVLVDADSHGKEGGLYSNLFTAHPPFQIDANFGFSAALAEMLVQSTMHDLYLLPALPEHKWPYGSVKGLKARGNVTVGVSWKEGELHEVGIWSNDQQKKNSATVKRLHYGGITVTATIASGLVYTFNKELKCVRSHLLLHDFP
ncbi:OLC1v1002982C1 [Oldenlandia corymbosa var. corymbosa]|uniref:OLC1v1002982C1 n=1 Tax=Oldenlandia corymbosa var. corymbosa TaxID=529605 RepID=A0AAV1DBE3_OLDCO|nr:OLC1v1002982C1 [Oldenlandia corymbosa var. corymbosa]